MREARPAAISTTVGMPLPQRGRFGRGWAALVAAWGVVVGIAVR